jgi:hypothetical protein
MVKHLSLLIGIIPGTLGLPALKRWEGGLEAQLQLLQQTQLLHGARAWAIANVATAGYRSLPGSERRCLA